MGNSWTNEFRRKRHASEEKPPTSGSRRMSMKSEELVVMKRRATMSIPPTKNNRNGSNASETFYVVRNVLKERQEQRTTTSSNKPLLTNYQKSLLIKSWNHYSFRNGHGNENIGVRIYLKLFDKYPETKAIFGFETLNANQLIFDQKFIRQTKLFITIIDDAFKNLDNLEMTVQPAFFALGGRHVKMRESGFKVQLWDVLAESMLECIIESQGIHKHRDTTVAWRVFTAWMIGVLKDGYYDTIKMQRRSTVPIDTTFKDKLQLDNVAYDDPVPVPRSRQSSMSVPNHANDKMKITHPQMFFVVNDITNAIMSRV